MYSRSADGVSCHTSLPSPAFAMVTVSSVYLFLGASLGIVAFGFTMHYEANPDYFFMRSKIANLECTDSVTCDDPPGAGTSYLVRDTVETGPTGHTMRWVPQQPQGYVQYKCKNQEQCNVNVAMAQTFADTQKYFQISAPPAQVNASNPAAISFDSANNAFVVTSGGTVHVSAVATILKTDAGTAEAARLNAWRGGQPLAGDLDPNYVVLAHGPTADMADGGTTDSRTTLTLDVIAAVPAGASIRIGASYDDALTGSALVLDSLIVTVTYVN